MVTIAELIECAFLKRRYTLNVGYSKNPTGISRPAYTYALHTTTRSISRYAMTPSDLLIHPIASSLPLSCYEILEVVLRVITLRCFR